MEVPEEFVGPVVDLLGSRKGQMVDMNTSDTGLTRVTYIMPTRLAFHHTSACQERVLVIPIDLVKLSV